MFGYKYSRLTIFHVIFFTGLIAGLYGGIVLGNKYFGIMGMIVGGILGAILGMAPFFVIDSWAHKQFFKDLQESSNEKLRANLEQDHWNFLQTMSLLQLAARKQDVELYFERVLAMLENESPRVREFGYDALRIVFTEKMKLSPDYNPLETTETCREKARRLRKP